MLPVNYGFSLTKATEPAAGGRLGSLSIYGTQMEGSTWLKGRRLLRKVKNTFRPPLPLFRILNHNKQGFACPLCGYEGPFADLRDFAGVRKHAMCPRCGALERHRLQYLALSEALDYARCQKMKMLHFAPERFFRPMFSRRFSKYETADLLMKGVDHKVDILSLPFEDGAYDVIFASHVLQYIQDDAKAIKEIRRVLRPNGVAILPVPVVCAETVEYPGPNPFENGHVRACGIDYFERYKEHFGRERVDIRASDSFPERYQLFTYENREWPPTRECPLRPPMKGCKHRDFVPLCYA